MTKALEALLWIALGVLIGMVLFEVWWYFRQQRTGKGG